MLEKICAIRKEGSRAAESPLEGPIKQKPFAFLLGVLLKFFFVSKKRAHARIFGETIIDSDPNVFQGPPDTIVANLDITFKTFVHFMNNFASLRGNGPEYRGRG